MVWDSSAIMDSVPVSWKTCLSVEHSNSELGVISCVFLSIERLLSGLIQFHVVVLNYSAYLFAASESVAFFLRLLNLRPKHWRYNNYVTE